MFYYKFIASTFYCGTENEFYEKFEAQPSSDTLEQIASEYADANAQDFEYLLLGWEDDAFENEEEKEEALNNYYADATCTYEQITESEYKEAMGE